MKKTVLIITTFLTIFCASGCGKTLEYKEYFSFYNQFEQGSFVEFMDSNCLYKLQYRPVEYMALSDLRSKRELITTENIDSIQNELAGSGYNFCIRIFSKDDSPILDEADVSYYQNISQLTSDFPLLVYGLTATGDTAYCRFSHFERSYNLQPFVQILFNLHSDNATEINSVNFTDEIFNQGSLIEFEINRYIKNLPKLKI